MDTFFLITISAGLVDYPTISNVNQDFTVSIQDRCDSTALSFDPVLASQVIWVNLAATATLRAIDTASIDYGAQDGYDLCGPRTYTVSAVYTEFWSLSGDTISLLATRPGLASINPYMLTVSVTLDNYPDIDAATMNIDVFIEDYCTSTILSFDPAPVDMQININQEE